MTPPDPKDMTDEEFRRHVLRIVEREFGLAGLARFMRVCLPGSGDYTRDRHKWLGGLSVQDITDELQSKQ